MFRYRQKTRTFLFAVLGISVTLIFANFAAAQRQGPVNVAVTAAFVSKHGVYSYEQIMDYIGEKVGAEFNILNEIPYEMANRLLKSGDVSIAFICGYAYIKQMDTVNMKLLALPLHKGETKPISHSYIIVHKDSLYKKFSDLKGRDFEFSDILSNSGYLMPAYKVIKLGYTPEIFFGAYRFSGAQDKSIVDVALKKTDAAAVDSLVWEYDNEFYPKWTSQTKIIDISEPFTIVPVVISGKFDKELAKKIQDILVNMHLDLNGKEILKRARLEKFILPDDSLFTRMREMSKAVDESLQKAKPAYR